MVYLNAVYSLNVSCSVSDKSGHLWVIVLDDEKD